MIHFLQRNAEVKPGFERVWKAKGCFHEADIDDDMILGYPWLHENRVAVLPGDNALGVGERGQCLVEGWPVTDTRTTAKTPAKTLPDWSVRKLQLGLRGDSQGGDIPGHQGLTEWEMVEAMNRCRLAAAEVTLAAKTLTTSEGTSEWVHQTWWTASARH